MLYRNQEQDRAFQFISQADFDIFCLQEVPKEFLARLQTLQCSVAFRSDGKQRFSENTRNSFVVILSRHPIIAQGEISFPDYWHLLPLRTRLFVHLMRPFHFSKVYNRMALFADIRVPSTVRPIRVFSIHLILAQPAWRLKEFELAMVHRDGTRPTIVCGDFNTLQTPHITLLNWLMGSHVSDALFYNRERTRIEKHFVEYKLTNALAGGITHPLSQSQLDHILVSNEFIIKNAEILPDRIGSDHHPIFVETT